MADNSEEGLAYLNFDPVASEYDASRNLPAEVVRWAVDRIRAVAELKPTDLFLDAGTGTGRFSLPLAEVTRVVGVDVSAGMLAAQRIKATDPQCPRLVRASLLQIPVPRATFRAALLVHILHLIRDWEEVLSEVMRTVEPDGMLFVAEEKGQVSPVRDYYFDVGRARGILPDHMGAKNIGEIVARLHSLGLDPQRIDEEKLRWQAVSDPVATLARLDKRVWSSQWALSDADHTDLMKQTSDWFRANRGALAAAPSDCSLHVWCARIP